MTTMSINKYLKLGNITVDLSLNDETVTLRNVPIPVTNVCIHCTNPGGTILTMPFNSYDIDDIHPIQFSHFMCLMQEEFSKMTEENKTALKRLMKPYQMEETNAN